MKEVLKASVRAGAIGFSTNQNPVHMYADGTPIQSRFATDEEIIELACALGEINQGAVQISRGSLGVSVPMRESVQLFDEISSRSGRPVIWQSITQRWDKPNEWRQLLDLAKESIGPWRAVLSAVQRAAVQQPADHEKCPGVRRSADLEDDSLFAARSAHRSDQRSGDAQEDAL